MQSYAELGVADIPASIDADLESTALFAQLQKPGVECSSDTDSECNMYGAPTADAAPEHRCKAKVGAMPEGAYLPPSFHHVRLD